MSRLLLLEDEVIILKALKRLLERNHYEVECASTVDDAIALQPRSFDIVLADLRLPGAPGTAIIEHTGPVPVVIMTSHASVRSAVEAMQQGATDYISKPFDHDELLIVLQRSLMQNLLQAQNHALTLELNRQLPWQAAIEGTTLQQQANELSASLESSPHPLTFTGEHGSGRESLARAVHAGSNRRHGPVLVYSAQATNGQAASTEWSGMGGLMTAAHNGTLVLRNPGHLPKSVQQELAASLAETATRSSSPGSSHAVQIIAVIDESVTAAASALSEPPRMLTELTRCLTVHCQQVGALRNRVDDILPTAQALLDHLLHRMGRASITFDQSATAALMAHTWPGNLPELEAMLMRACSRRAEHSAGASQLTAGELSLGPVGEADRDLGLDAYFRYFVRRHQDALTETELASRLGISRKALWERRQKMQLLRQPANTDAD